MHSDMNHKLDFALDLDFSQILTNSILDRAACFWEEERYRAFQICYRSMRRIDDLVDDRRGAGMAISGRESAQLKTLIFDWIGRVQRGEVSEGYPGQFLQTLDRFRIPFWPWERFGKAMAYDVDHNGYPTFHRFLRYSEGAAVAPAAVFVHLCGVSSESDRYRPPRFDIHEAARPLAIFAYIVHIIRDFRKDQLEGLNYFAADLMQEHDLSSEDLRMIAEGNPPGVPFSDLINAYVHRAHYYGQKATAVFTKILPHLEDRYQLSLQIIYALYRQILERVDPEALNCALGKVDPLPDDVNRRVERVVANFRPVRR